MNASWIEPSTFDQRATSIFNDNVERGWWKRGEHGVVIPRNAGELLALIHSEIDEAHSDKMDDKLPHRREFEVELADVQIRVFDMLGYYRELLELDLYTCYRHIQIPECYPLPEYGETSWLLHMHKLTTEALEHFRKGRPTHGCTSLVKLLVCVNMAGQVFQLDLVGAVDEKLAFNAHREDHKLENRQKEGGKAF